MHNTVQYKLYLTQKNDMFGLTQTNPNNTILLSDNKQSKFQLSDIRYKEPGGFLKKIHNIQHTPRTSKITANTSMVRITDVYDLIGAPLFYKILLPKIMHTIVYINGTIPDYQDKNFIYTNEKDVLIEIYSLDNKLMSRITPEIFPVFIWAEQINLQHIIDIDNKKYSFRRNKDKTLITVSKTDVYAEVRNEPVFKMKRLKHNNIEIEPFFLKRSYVLDGKKTSYEYNYLKVSNQIITRKLERKLLYGNYMLDLDNIHILKESVIIYKNIDGVEVEILNNSLSEHNNIIHSEKGVINLLNMIDNHVVDIEDILYVTYQYLHNNNMVNINHDQSILRNNKVHLQVRPTTVFENKTKVEYEPHISYAITDMHDNLISIEDNSDSHNYAIIQNIQKIGYGVNGYSENGYSGIKLNSETVYLNGQYTDDYGNYQYASGFGETGYGEGVYGGSQLGTIPNLNSLQSLKALLDIKDIVNNPIMTIGSIAFKHDIDIVNIHFYDEKAKILRKELISRDAYNFANTIWQHNLSPDTDQEEIVQSHAAQSIMTHATIDFAPSISINNDDRAVILFDIKNISTGLDNTTGEIEPSMVLSQLTDTMAFSDLDKYDRIMPQTNDNITHVALFSYSKEEYTLENIPVYISNDLQQASVTIDKSLYPDLKNIGLGYNNNDIQIYPTTNIVL